MHLHCAHEPVVMPLKTRRALAGRGDAMYAFLFAETLGTFLRGLILVDNLKARAALALSDQNAPPFSVDTNPPVISFCDHKLSS